MKKIMFISTLFFLFISFPVQGQLKDESDAYDKIVAEAKRGGYQLITPEELKREYLKDPASFLLVDTRQEWAYQMQYIRGSSHLDFTPTWWNQYSPITRSEMKNLLGPDKNKKVVFY